MAKVSDLLKFVGEDVSFSYSTYDSLRRFIYDNPGFEYFHLMPSIPQNDTSNSDIQKARDAIREVLGDNPEREVAFTNNPSLVRVMLSRSPDNENMMKLTLMGLITRYQAFEDWFIINGYDDHS